MYYVFRHFANYYKIPKGDFCYEFVKKQPNVSRIFPQSIICPYWTVQVDSKGIKYGFCELLQNNSVFLDVKLKECGLREYTEKENEQSLTLLKNK